MNIEIKETDRLKGLKEALEAEIKTLEPLARRKALLESYLYYVQVQYFLLNRQDKER